MDKAIMKRVRALESVKKQGMPDKVRVTMKDGTTRICDYYEPVYDGTFEDIINVELIAGIGEGAGLLIALSQEGESDE